MVHLRTQKEIDKISKSCQIVADTLIMLEKHVVPGMAVKELDKMAEEYITDKGARPAFKGYMGFPATLCVSIDDVVVHGIPGNETLRSGQIVGIDCGAELDGYYGDHAKTFSVGNIDSEKAKLVTITKESLDRAINKAIPGNYVGDIGFAVQNFVEGHGYSVVRELVGHGIGTQLHEEPQIPNYGSEKQGHLLKAGMCIAIEPMINLGRKEIYTDKDGWSIKTKDGQVSAHFEHTIVITDNEPKILSVASDG
tara:strand:+ start:7547 stop:8302 length:756 start_codon:yes stop_codon:yes gene_type:complete